MDEPRRLACLKSYGVLDSAPDPRFDRLTELCARLLDAPMATISLIDEKRQWFKSRQGVAATQTPRAHSFCAHVLTVAHDDVLVVEDATRDARFKDSPLVTGSPGVRFYAGAPLVTPDGHVLGALCINDVRPRPRPTDLQLDQLRSLAAAVMDQLELHRLLQSNREHRRLLEMTERMSGVGHWRFDLVSEALEWSDELYVIYGLSRSDFTPQVETAMQLFHPDDRAAAQQFFDSVRTFGHEGGFQLRIVRSDGTVREVACHSRREHDASGRPAALFGVIQDVTDFVEAQRRAEAAAEAKAEFLANMSHELRTPLTSIVGFTGLLTQHPQLPPAAREWTQRIDTASKALLASVNDILDFSKLERGQVTILPRPLALEEFSRTILGLFSPQAGAKDLSLRLEYEAPADLVVTCDEDRLRQVLLNLVGNAVKFTTDGEVVLRAVYDASAERLRIEVRDTGPGIPRDQQAKLFQRFSQIDGSLARRFGGTGLGLAICRGLIEAMSGEVGLDSALGQGSVFWLEIPAPRAEGVEVGAEADPGAGALPPGLRVLVVDDHPVNRELARIYLRAFGAEITEADSGEAALAAAGTGLFDVVLLDLRMPGLSGWDTLARLRGQAGPNCSVPVLAYSADVADNTRELEAAGFAGLVAKPVQPQALLQALCDVAGLTDWMRAPDAA
jgi:PAS domain S-box-containing protein